MRFTRLKTRSFASVAECDITFGPGLNVVFGPNELGKSTLTQAIRAALLLQHTSRLHESWIPWTGTGSPHVELTFETEPGRFWRITKTFASSGRSQLDESKDAENWRKVHSGRRVDAEVRKLLRWGLPETGKTKGLPDAFLTAVLLPQQGETTKLLSENINTDKDESGKQLLREAMQAMSTDPLFKRILTETGKKYDSAFTPTGRRSNAGASPFREISDRIKKAESRREQLQGRKQQAESVESELHTLQQELTAATEAFKNAEARHRELTQSAAQLESLRKDIAARSEALDLLNKQKGEIEALEQAAMTAQTEAESIAEQVDQADAELMEATREVESLEKQLDDLTNDATVAKQLVEKERQERELKDSRARLELLRSQKARVEDIQRRESELAHLNEQLDDVKLQSAVFDGLRKWHQTIVSRRRCEAVEAAVSLQAQVAKLEAALPATPPTRDELELVTELESELGLAKARCGVELRVRIAPERELQITVECEGEEPDAQTIDAPIEVEANSLVKIEVSDVGRIEVEAGAVEDVEELARLQTRWDEDAAPILTRCQCTDSRGLRSVVDSADELTRLTESLAEDLERLHISGDESGSTLVSAQAEREEADQAFAEAEPESLADHIQLLEQQPLDRRLQAIEGNAAQSTEEMTGLRSRISGLEAERAALVTQFDSDEEAAGLHHDSATWTEHASELADVLKKQQALVTDLEATVSAAASPVSADELRKQVDAARQSQADASEHREGLESSLKETRSKADQLAGELNAARKAFSQEEYEKADAALTDVREHEEKILADGAPTAEQLTAVAENVEALRTRAETIRNSLQQKQGGLKEVGGDIAKEQFDEAHQALLALQEQEQQLHLDYDAWKLLLESLRTAEKSQSAHLGQTLMEPVAEQVRELTGNRYGGLALGPALETEGVSFGGANRDVDRLSLGTQEQFSTIMRLALARQLKSVLVLDDQLTQSDPERMGWFRELLHQSAEEHQIIVFTCRQTDYLLPSELPDTDNSKTTGPVTAINLSRLLSHAPNA